MASTQRAPSSRPVLIAGAGPVGLTAALNLVRRGIPVTVLEAGDRIVDDPRAGTIHPPTLELFATVGVTDAMLARGYVVRNYQYRDRRTGVVADFDLGALADDTPYPVPADARAAQDLRHPARAAQAAPELRRC